MFGVGMGLAPFLVSLNKDLQCKGVWSFGAPSRGRAVQPFSAPPACFLRSITNEMYRGA